MFTVNDHARMRGETGLALRVLLNGRDITGDCFAADLRGYAYCFVHDARGRVLIGRDADGQCTGPAWRVVFGEVRFEVGA